MDEVVLEDIIIRYRILGEGAPILLVHGLGSDMRGWEFQEGPLSKHFTVILLDQRGHGRSTGPGMDMVTADIFAHDLERFLEHLRIEKVSIVGTSMGGLIAQQFTLDFPERVNKLALISTGPRITEEVVDEVYSWREAQIEGGDEAYFWASLKSCYPEEFVKNNKETVDYLMNMENLLNMEGVMAAGLGLSMFNAEDRLYEISVPTLIVHGEKDRIFNISLARRMAELIPTAELVILPRCGHSPGVQMPERLNELLINFLRK